MAANILPYGRSTDHQAILLDRLGLHLPRQLKVEPSVQWKKFTVHPRKTGTSRPLLINLG